jgi:putative tryptophan/tyrosine transport system substrate-binding protein
MASYIGRRKFVAALGGAAAAWPLAARAQQPAIPVVGFLRSTPSASFDHIVAAFRQGLSEVGFVDGRNIAIQQRWAEGRDDRLPTRFQSRSYCAPTTLLGGAAASWPFAAGAQQQPMPAVP